MLRFHSLISSVVVMLIGICFTNILVHYIGRQFKCYLHLFIILLSEMNKCNLHNLFCTFVHFTYQLFTFPFEEIFF